MWQNSRTQTVIKLKQKNLWQNLKYPIVTKLKNSNCAKLKNNNYDNSKTQVVIVIKITVVTEVVIMTSFSKNTLIPWQPTNSQCSFSQLLWCFLLRWLITKTTNCTKYSEPLFTSFTWSIFYFVYYMASSVNLAWSLDLNVKLRWERKI